ncbi:hypothetical protein RB595_004655 [Gaeumannomyces hyphopodioides]
MEAASLLKLTTALDQGSSEHMPQKLEELWQALTGCVSGGSHATEKVILRWLLKAMNGPSPDAETLRRYPLTWAIMGCVFARIPLFSLAKALADRRFVGILQQTAKDLSTPCGPDAAARPDAAAGTPKDSLKRKRSPSTPFDLEALRHPRGCLESAGPLFAALGVLLSRVAPKDASPPAGERAGAEHIKALFRAPAAEAIAILSPLLAICDLAIKNQGAVDMFDGQQSWIRTATGLWELHLHKTTDALEFAIHTAGPCCLMLTELPDGGSASTSLGLSREVSVAWARDLKRLAIRNFTMPARSEFLTQKRTEVIGTPVRLNSLQAAVLSPAIFLLVLETPSAIGGTSAIRDNKEWLETVFDLLESALRSLGPVERSAVVKQLLRMALAHGCTPSLASLQFICGFYAISNESVDWALVSALAECDADVFLASGQGRSLLSDIMKRAHHSSMSDGGDDDSLCSMMLSLASASMRAREFPRFVNQWFDNLTECFAAAASLGTPSANVFWFDIRVTSAVSSFIQQALTTKQLTGLIGNLAEAKSPSAQTARVIVFDAICRGITAEDFIDAAARALFETVWTDPIPFNVGEASAAQWRIASKAFTWGLATREDGLGRRVVKALEKVLGKKRSQTSDPAIFDAFRCAAAAWSSSYAGDGSTADPGSAIPLILSRLGLELRDTSLDCNDSLLAIRPEPTQDVTIADPFRPFQLSSISATTYVVWVLLWFPRLVSILPLPSADAPPEFVVDVLRSICRIDIAAGDGAQACHDLCSMGLINSMGAIHSEKPPLRGLVDPVINILSGSDSSPGATAGFLVRLPGECLSRNDRERIVSSLFDLSLKQSTSTEDGWVFGESALGAMVQMMRVKPTLCPELNFRGLLELGSRVVPRVSKREKHHSERPPGAETVALRLLEELARLTLGQMTASSGAREMAYVQEIWPVLSEHIRKQRHDGGPVALTLLSVFISSMRQPGPSKHFTQEVTCVDEATKELCRLVTEVMTKFVEAMEKKERKKKVEADARCLFGLQTALSAFEACWGPELEASLMPLREKISSVYPALRRVDPELGSLLASLLSDRLGLHPAADQDDPSDRELNLNKVRGLVDVEGDVAKAGLLRKVTARLRQSPTRPEQLLTARLALKQIKATYPPEAATDLSMAQSALAQLLVQPGSLADFVDAARASHALLDEKSTSATQWNVEHTLASICLLCSPDNPATEVVRRSAQTFEWLCHLTEAVLKRHRRRLDGHLHLLVATLQSLLSCLIRHPYDSDRQGWASGVAVGTTSGKYPHWEKHARMFARLLTLVCEPSVASVARSQQGATLDSATDAAKRVAGQYMYLVVVALIRLQLEGNVPHGVREALLPGVYSILDITPPDLRRVMADAMDSSGRAIWKDLYEKYRKFGKWRGT